MRGPGKETGTGAGGQGPRGPLWLGFSVHPARGASRSPLRLGCAPHVGPTPDGRLLKPRAPVRPQAPQEAGCECGILPGTTPLSPGWVGLCRTPSKCEGKAGVSCGCGPVPAREAVPVREQGSRRARVPGCLRAGAGRERKSPAPPGAGAAARDCWLSGSGVLGRGGTGRQEPLPPAGKASRGVSAFLSLGSPRGAQQSEGRRSGGGAAGPAPPQTGSVPPPLSPTPSVRRGGLCRSSGCVTRRPKASTRVCAG